MTIGAAQQFFLGASKATGGGAAGYQIERSLRFSSNDSAYLSRTPAVAGSRTTWTWAGWVKASVFGATDFTLFSRWSVGDYYTTVRFNQQILRIEQASGAGYDWYVRTTRVFRDPSAWYHIVVAINTNLADANSRVKLYVNGVEESAANFTRSNPARYSDTWINTTSSHSIGEIAGQGYFNGYLADIHFIDGQALDATAFTEVSATTGQLIPKRYTGSFGTNGFWLQFADNSNNTAATLGKDTSGNGNNWTPNNFTATELYGRLYRQATGTATSAFSSANFVGNFPASASGSYIYDVELNTSVTTATFGYLYAFGGVEVLVSSDGTNWTSKGVQTNAYTTVTNSTSFKYVRWFIAQSWIHGITNNPANIDSTVDTPTSYGTDSAGVGGVVRGNYATLNPLDAHSSLTITNGNLDLSNTASTTRNVRGTIGFPSSGKWYYEVTPGGYVSGAVGIGSSAVPLDAQNAASSVIYFEDGTKGVDASRTAYGASYASGNVIGVAFNADTNQVTFYKNGVSQGALSTTAGVQYFPFIVTFNATYSANFGQRAFAYTAPSGFKALCDTNLGAPVVALPNTVFDVVTYTGTGAALTPTSSLGFNPDWIWIKSRSAATDHALYDVVRGTQARVESNNNGAEVTSDGGVTAFNSAGFTLGTLAQVNTNSATYVAWCWDAGTSTVPNTTGSIASQVRANVSAGFSVVTYTGTGVLGTVGHGLGAVPDLIIVKRRDFLGSFYTYHSSIGNTGALGLDLTNATIVSSNFWNNTSPTSSVLTINNASTELNANGGTYVLYVFSRVVGYSSMGSYVGNGSSDGPFVFCNFRPRWIMIKNSSGAFDWELVDTSRDPVNGVNNNRLQPNLSAAEAAGYPVFDILSNGFKVRNSASNWNGSTNVIIYAAFAENPFQYARAR